eukprot:1962573-Prymnesium_polylepis.2
MGKPPPPWHACASRASRGRASASSPCAARAWPRLVKLHTLVVPREEHVALHPVLAKRRNARRIVRRLVAAP